MQLVRVMTATQPQAVWPQSQLFAMTCTCELGVTEVTRGGVHSVPFRARFRKCISSQMGSLCSLSLLFKITLFRMTSLFLPFTSVTHKFGLNRCVVSITNSVSHQRISVNQRIPVWTLWDRTVGETSALFPLPSPPCLEDVPLGLNCLKFFLINYWVQILYLYWPLWLSLTDVF